MTQDNKQLNQSGRYIYPIVTLSTLTPNTHFQQLEKRINALEPGEYRAKYKSIKKCLITNIRKAGYTKLEAEKIAHNYLNSHLWHPYIEEKTDGGLYDVFYIEKQIEQGFYNDAIPEFWQFYQGYRFSSNRSKKTR